MARANVPLTQLSRFGDNPDSGAITFDSANGAMFSNPNHSTSVVLINNGAGTHIITFPTPATVAKNLAIQDPTVTIGAGKRSVVGNFDPALYNQPSGDDVGKVYMNSDGSQTEVVAKAYRS